MSLLLIYRFRWPFQRLNSEFIAWFELWRHTNVGLEVMVEVLGKAALTILV